MSSCDRSDRFFSHFAAINDGCWLWQGFRAHGYGRFRISPTRTAPAHRFSYQLLRGPVPDGFEIDHLCHDAKCTLGEACPHRGCINPWHMRLVTHRENMASGRSNMARWRNPTHCPQGHEYSPENIYRYGKRRMCRTCALARTKRCKDAAKAQATRN
jgi:hypothetical protein